GRDRPDAAIGEAGHAIDVARRLRLRARVDQRRHLPRTRATVVAETVDVDVVAGRGRFDLEGDRLALVDADVSGEPLNRGGARARQVPTRGAHRDGGFR